MVTLFGRIEAFVDEYCRVTRWRCIKQRLIERLLRKGKPTRDQLNIVYSIHMWKHFS
jgi:hypothetical protein